MIASEQRFRSLHRGVCCQLRSSVVKLAGPGLWRLGVGLRFSCVLIGEGQLTVQLHFVPHQQKWYGFLLDGNTSWRFGGRELWTPYLGSLTLIRKADMRPLLVGSSPAHCNYRPATLVVS